MRRRIESGGGAGRSRRLPGGAAWLWVLALAAPPAALAGAEAPARLRVLDPYIELHTGPAAVYPITYVVERGAQVEIRRRRTDWFEVRTADGRLGWVDREQLLRTLDPAGAAPLLRAPRLTDFQARRRELGVLGGDFAGANVVNLYAGYGFTDNLSVELSVSEVLGRFSSSRLLALNLLHQPFPRWRVSPYFGLGTGQIQVSPAPTLVEAEDREDNFSNVALGFKAYLARRFMLRFDYRSYVVFTSRDDNEEPEEWKLGFGFFF